MQFITMTILYECWHLLFNSFRWRMFIEYGILKVTLIAPWKDSCKNTFLTVQKSYYVTHFVDVPILLVSVKYKVIHTFYVLSIL